MLKIILKNKNNFILIYLQIKNILKNYQYIILTKPVWGFSKYFSLVNASK
jgi:hypothetical protein